MENEHTPKSIKRLITLITDSGCKRTPSASPVLLKRTVCHGVTLQHFDALREHHHVTSQGTLLLPFSFRLSYRFRGRGMTNPDQWAQERLLGFLSILLATIKETERKLFPWLGEYCSSWKKGLELLKWTTCAWSSYGQQAMQWITWWGGEELLWVSELHAALSALRTMWDMFW